jgi:hypothetical protein
VDGSVTLTITTASSEQYTVEVPPVINNVGIKPQDNLVRNIFIRGGFWSGDDTVFIPATEIKKIVVNP